LGWIGIVIAESWEEYHSIILSIGIGFWERPLYNGQSSCSSEFQRYMLTYLWLSH
jgi:hypothetical protein